MPSILYSFPPFLPSLVGFLGQRQTLTLWPNGNPDNQTDRSDD